MLMSSPMEVPEMEVSYRTDNGFLLRVFSTGYVDWGFEVTDPDDNQVFYSPHYLAADTYGFNDPDDDVDELDDLDMREQPAVRADGERTPWTEREWLLWLESDAETLLEGAIGDKAYVDDLPPFYRYGLETENLPGLELRRYMRNVSVSVEDRFIHVLEFADENADIVYEGLAYRSTRTLA